MKQVILYGIAGADKGYKVLRYFVIGDELISISNIRYCASTMRNRYPSVEHVFAVDNRYGLKKDYIEAIKRDSMESYIELKDILEREGIKII